MQELAIELGLPKLDGSHCTATEVSQAGAIRQKVLELVHAKTQHLFRIVKERRANVTLPKAMLHLIQRESPDQPEAVYNLFNMLCEGDREFRGKALMECLEQAAATYWLRSGNDLYNWLNTTGVWNEAQASR